MNDDTPIRLVLVDDREMYRTAFRVVLMVEAKPCGKVGLEGKDEVMADGDVVEFRHNYPSK